MSKQIQLGIAGVALAMFGILLIERRKGKK